MSNALKLFCVSALIGCTSEIGRSMPVSLQPASNVSTSGINGITLYLFGVDCSAGPRCDALLTMAMYPRGGDLVAFSETRAQPGTYVHVDTAGLGSACAMLYVEAYATPAFPGKTLAAGCADITLPDSGAPAVAVDMISVTDGDSDGWIGQFNFPDSTHTQGPDCNDADVNIYPGAAEVSCTGDHNCDGKASCERQCQSNADCATAPNNARCCSFSPNWMCQPCSVSNCAESSDCNTTLCCEHSSSTCEQPTTGTLCNCATQQECSIQGTSKCCVSNQNTSGDLIPGTCGDVQNWYATHPGSSFFTEWCRCENRTQCAVLFPSLAGQICCVTQRGVCDLPRVGETCM
jgi:Putative metal-binding motif